MRKEHTVNTNISNAKVIRYDRPGGNCPRLGVRRRAGEDFQSVSYDGSPGFKWSEEEMVDTHNVTVLEEFPSLKEIVEGAPVFLAKDNHGVMWSFTLYESGGPFTRDDVFIPSRVSPIGWDDKGTFSNIIRYYLEEIASSIDLSTVQPLYPRE